MVPLYKPYMPDDLPELNSILHSGALAYGKWGKIFEQALQSYLECTNLPIVVNSFTAAIQVTLAALGLKAGDEIIASPQSCLASTMPLLSFGLKVIWADIDPMRGTLCPQSVEKKISLKTKAIFHNHHCGYPGYIDEINEIAKRKGLLVIDDCIEAFGARYKGKMMGCLDADATLFSFQTVRLPNTIDGGGVVFKSQEHVAKAVRIRDLGVDRSTFRDAWGEINPASDVPFAGFGVTMNEISSYIGYMQLSQITVLLEKQKNNAISWEKILKDIYPDIQLLKTDETEPNFWVYGFLSSEKMCMLSDFRAKGFYASGVHLNNNSYSAFGKQEELVGVKEFMKRFIAIPCGWWMNANVFPYEAANNNS